MNVTFGLSMTGPADGLTDKSGLIDTLLSVIWATITHNNINMWRKSFPLV